MPRPDPAAVEAARAAHRAGRRDEVDRLCARFAAEADLPGPDRLMALADIGQLLYELGRTEAAARIFARGENLAPRDPGFALNHAIALHQLGRLAPAIEGYRRAAGLDPLQAGVPHALGLALAGIGDSAGAIRAYCEAIRLDPHRVASYVGLGLVLQKLDRFDEAREAFERALALAPDDTLALGNLVHLKQYACDWDGLAELEQRLLAAVDAGRGGVAPFVLLAMPSTRAQQLAAARRASDGIAARAVPLPPPVVTPMIGRRLRLGYLSADFHQHATACLMIELFESHDRVRFEVFAYSYGPDDGSAMRARLTRAFEHFVDLAPLDHAQAAARIRADGIDVLIDLKGHTTDSRLGILAYRPAPLQATFLGYPGTTGAGFIDCVIADAVVLPPEHEAGFSERVVRLPGCYQPNDAGRVIAPRAPTRTASGLPEQAFVFCCFNNSFKIRPELFEIWMRLLAELPGSVLWLLEGNPAMAANLRAAAWRHGIAEERMVFAPRLPLPEHLARHRLADLFLDTQPYNAHTTASDALWAGVPVLTVTGDSFAGRVAASLLLSLGLPELVAASPADYRRRALDLAQDPAALSALRARLGDAVGRAPVFSGRAFARTFEQALCNLWRCRKGH